jgi:hypothetical protein
MHAHIHMLEKLKIAKKAPCIHAHTYTHTHRELEKITEINKKKAKGNHLNTACCEPASHTYMRTYIGTHTHTGSSKKSCIDTHTHTHTHRELKKTQKEQEKLQKKQSKIDAANLKGKNALASMKVLVDKNLVGMYVCMYVCMYAHMNVYKIHSIT